jgi:hypothetical protein
MTIDSLKNILPLRMRNENFNSNKLIYIPKRVIVAILTSLGLLILTVIQTNFAITNSLILNPHHSKDIPVDDDQPPNAVRIENILLQQFRLFCLGTKSKLDIG